MKISAAFAAAFLLCTNVVAGELDLSFNSDAFRFFYIHDLANNDLAWDAGLLNNSDKGYVVNVSLYLTGFASDGTNPLQAAIGGRTGIVSGDDSGQSGAPIALGGYVKYTFPELNRLSVRVDGYFAPDILTLSDLEKYQDYTLRVGYNILQEADLYIGARYVKGNFDNNTSQLFDDGLHLGVNIRF